VDSPGSDICNSAMFAYLKFYLDFTAEAQRSQRKKECYQRQAVMRPVQRSRA
jgi:hypothetical protein